MGRDDGLESDDELERYNSLQKNQQTNCADLLQPVYLEDTEGVVVELRGCLVQNTFQCSLDNGTGS